MPIVHDVPIAFITLRYPCITFMNLDLMITFMRFGVAAHALVPGYYGKVSFIKVNGVLIGCCSVDTYYEGCPDEVKLPIDLCRLCYLFGILPVAVFFLSIFLVY